jgi:hypothetical protein
MLVTMKTVAVTNNVTLNMPSSVDNDHRFGSSRHNGYGAESVSGIICYRAHTRLGPSDPPPFPALATSDVSKRAETLFTLPPDDTGQVSEMASLNITKTMDNVQNNAMYHQ